MKSEVRQCDPPATAIASWYEKADLLDCYCFALADGTPTDARVLARLALSDPPWAFRCLIALRDRLVAPLGIRSSDDIRNGAAEDARIDFFPVLSESADEVLVGEDDRHLDFRTSLAVVGREGSSYFVSTTAVRCHNLTGRLYLAIIRPFHVAVVRSGLRRLAKRLGPTGSSAQASTVESSSPDCTPSP